MDKAELFARVVVLLMVGSMAVVGLKYGFSQITKVICTLLLLGVVWFGLDVVRDLNSFVQEDTTDTAQKESSVTVQDFDFKEDHNYPTYILDEGKEIPVVNPKFVEVDDKSMTVQAAKILNLDGSISYSDFTVKVPKGTVLE